MGNSWKPQSLQQALVGALRAGNGFQPHRREREEPLGAPTSQGSGIRINIQHRLVYQVLDDLGVVKILRLWTHYE
ncbi:MAG: type II toxin-antitoxin system mRNA interferase toxin, RelE/StbE family [Acidobacteria bacterium]|nr:type II toxin-antitoxin system mRNA interferase toxin, RelE/StbE family [Acidobacteriota bacterium]